MSSFWRFRLRLSWLLGLMLGILVCAYVGILWPFCGGYVTVGFWLVALLWFGGFDCCDTGF